MSDKESILILGKYFGYQVGGAEASALAMLREREAQGKKIHYVFVENVEGFNCQSLKSSLPESWQRHSLRIPYDLSRFKYVDYLLNRQAVEDFITNLKFDGRLLAYGLLAPAALKAHSGSKTYIIRDEWGVGVDANYYHGVKRVLCDAYRFAESPFKKTWMKDLLRGVEGCDEVITNSQYMADRAKALFGEKKYVVEYPHIDGEALKTRWSQLREKRKANGKVVVSVGKDRIKGFDIVEQLAQQRPDLSFRVYDRAFLQREQKGNLTLEPWARSSAEILAAADVVMVPSRCNEGFSRLVREAKIVGLPVLASNSGGIPEAAIYPATNAPHELVNDVDSIPEWKQKLGTLI